MENSGKMTYPEVINAFSKMLYNLRSHIASDSFVLGITIILIIFSVINMHTTTNAAIYIVLILFIIALVFLAFIDIRSLVKDLRIYSRDRKRFNAMFTETSADSPENNYMRFILTLFIAQGQVICKKDLTFIPRIPNTSSVEVNIQNLTPLGIWDMLSQKYPSIHACQIHDAGNNHFYILHLDNSTSATCTFLSACGNSAHHSLWNYKIIALPITEDFASTLDTYLNHAFFKKLNICQVLDWENAESVNTFNSLAFPTHQTIAF